MSAVATNDSRTDAGGPQTGGVTMVRRLSGSVRALLGALAVFGVGALVSLGTARVAIAAPPHETCPAAASGWGLVDADGWWDTSVLGFEKAGVPVYEADGETFTDAFDDFVFSELGFADGASLESFVRGEQFDAYDKNQDEFVCMQAVPGIGAVPYLFNGSDNRRNGGE